MATKQLEAAKDHFTQEVAHLKSVNIAKTFGVNCGSTFRAPVRLMSRIQSYLQENHDVPVEQMATTGDALESLILALGIVDADSDDVALYFDSRKESVIEDDRAQAAAEAQEATAATADASDDRYNKLSSQVYAMVKKLRAGDDDAITYAQMRDAVNGNNAISNAHKKQLVADIATYEAQDSETEEVDLFA